MLPTRRIPPRDSAAANDDRVTIQADTAAHQGSSEWRTSAARAATATDNAAASACVPRGPCGSSERNSVPSARAISSHIGLASVEDQRTRIGAHMEHNVWVLIL